MLAFLVFALGCRSIATHEGAIANASFTTSQLAQRIERNDLSIAHAAALRRSEKLVWLDLGKVSGQQRPAASVASFLRGLEHLASQLHIAVVSVTFSSESLATRSESTGLAALPISILVRGDFRAIVRFIQESTRQEALAGFESAQIASSPIPSIRRNALDATVHVTLYRVLLNFADVAAH